MACFHWSVAISSVTATHQLPEPEEAKWNSAIINFTICTCAALTVTCQNVIDKKRSTKINQEVPGAWKPFWPFCSSPVTFLVMSGNVSCNWLSSERLQLNQIEIDTDWYLSAAVRHGNWQKSARLLLSLHTIRINVCDLDCLHQNVFLLRGYN